MAEQPTLTYPEHSPRDYQSNREQLKKFVITRWIDIANGKAAPEVAGAQLAALTELAVQAGMKKEFA